MRSKGSRFTLGGVFARRCVYVRNRPQPSPTVRNRSREERMAVPCRAYGEFCKSGHFWRFQMSRSFVPRGRRGAL